MDEATRKEEVLWEAVLDVLSENGRLARYYRVPRNEMRAISKTFGRHTNRDVTRLFYWVKAGRFDLAREFLSRVGDYRTFCMLKELSRSMKCWVETGSSAKQSLKAWPVAHA